VDTEGIKFASTQMQSYILTASQFKHSNGHQCP
jgi:hypothetical protein